MTMFLCKRCGELHPCVAGWYSKARFDAIPDEVEVGSWACPWDEPDKLPATYYKWELVWIGAEPSILPQQNG